MPCLLGMWAGPGVASLTENDRRYLTLKRERYTLTKEGT